jgi:hypothetical protein
MVAAGFVVENVVLAATAVALCIANALQLALEFRLPFGTTGLKFWFHRLSALGGLLLLVRSVDPRGVYDVLTGAPRFAARAWRLRSRFTRRA